MGNWVLGERRGPAWKHGWTQQTLASMSCPPLPLLAIFFIIFILLSLSSYVSYRNQMQQTVIGFKLFLLFVPVVMVLLVQMVYTWEGLFLPPTKASYHGSGQRPSSSWNVPWGVILLVLLLLVLIAFQSTF